MMSGSDGGGEEGGKKESEISPPSLPSSPPPPPPRGFRFVPTDEDAVYYLDKKINGGVLEKVVPIQDKNIYGEIPPWVLFSDLKDSSLKDDERFVFTPITPVGSRIERSVGNQGTWKNQGRPRNIFDNDVNSMSGTKRNFSYSKKQDGDESSWIMDEYTLIQGDQPNLAFCRIRYRKRKSKRSAAVAAHEVEPTKRNKGSAGTETDLMEKIFSEMDLKSPLVDAADEDEEADASQSDEEEEEDDEFQLSLSL